LVTFLATILPKIIKIVQCPSKL